MPKVSQGNTTGTNICFKGASPCISISCTRSICIFHMAVPKSMTGLHYTIDILGEMGERERCDYVML